MIGKLLEPHPFWAAFTSLAVIVIGLIGFEITVTQQRTQSESIAHFSPGDEIPYIHASVTGFTREGGLMLFDQFGGVIRTQVKNKAFPLNTYIVLKGRLTRNRDMSVETMLPYPPLDIKIYFSLCAVAFLLLRLAGKVKILPRGIWLSSPEEPCRTL